jgi:hypothetical protein
MFKGDLKYKILLNKYQGSSKANTKLILIYLPTDVTFNKSFHITLMEG